MRVSQYYARIIVKPEGGGGGANDGSFIVRSVPRVRVLIICDVPRVAILIIRRT